MEFSIISEMFEMMEKTTKRIELTNILVELLKKTPKESSGIVLKTLAYLVCLMCWATIILGSFSLSN